MTRARKEQVDISETGYYSCVTRVVRRAFLCGDDPVSGRNFDHRKGWILELLQLLTSVSDPLTPPSEDAVDQG